MNECGCATPAEKRVCAPCVQMKDIEIEIEIEISRVSQELSELKSKLKKVELQLDKGTDAKGTPLSAADARELKDEKKVLNQQIAGLQEEKNFLLKKQTGMLPPLSPSPGDPRSLFVHESEVCVGLTMIVFG
jgi:hypothetical protein